MGIVKTGEWLGEKVRIEVRISNGGVAYLS